MSFNEAKAIILKEISKSGYKLREHNSKTTNSFYFEISSSCASLLFRVSDHSTGKNVITFRVDHKTNRDNLLRFVKNRISDLSARTTKKLLGI